MKKLFTLIMLAAATQAFSSDPREVFVKAASAYDAGDFAGAARTYETLLQDGVAPAEVLYNLGNAHFKQGHFGEAVLNYRRAWMVQPRDPDTQANLRFALQQAGAVAPEAPLLPMLARRLSKREWICIGVIAYWVCAAALALALLAPARRSFGLKAAGLAASLGLAAFVGLSSWWSLERRPELVVVGAAQKALFGPGENATPHFSLPPGSIVRMAESAGPWLKIEYGKDAGWIRRAGCVPVYPLDVPSTPTNQG